MGLLAFLRVRGGNLGLCSRWGADGWWQSGSSEGSVGNGPEPSHDPGALLLTKTYLAFST